MDLPSREVVKVLAKNGIDKIYHANSVITACQFLREGSLLSRGTVERNGWDQSPQQSDSVDRRYGIWFDVFADQVDIHDRARRKNAYGPVLFVLDAQIIRHAKPGKVWMTKRNPTKWARLKQGERWFRSTNELSKGFIKGEFDQMIVFRHRGGELPFADFLLEVILDDPKVKKNVSGLVDLYSMAFGALTLAKTEGRIDAEITKRQCPSDCNCRSEYRADRTLRDAMFVPYVQV